MAAEFDPLGGIVGAEERQRRADALDDTRSWVDPNGRRLSDRLWRAKREDRRRIDDILRRGLAAGASPLDVARELEGYLTPLGAKSATRTPNAGAGNAAARTLARTETSRAHARATLQSSALNPFVRGVRWQVSARHARPDECDRHASRDSGMGRGVYRVEGFPPMPQHPNCLCVAVPVVVERTADVVAALRRDYGLSSDPAAIPSPPGRLRVLVSSLFRIASSFGRTA